MPALLCAEKMAEGLQEGSVITDTKQNRWKVKCKLPQSPVFLLVNTITNQEIELLLHPKLGPIDLATALENPQTIRHMPQFAKFEVSDW